MCGEMEIKREVKRVQWKWGNVNEKSVPLIYASQKLILVAKYVPQLKYFCCNQISVFNKYVKIKKMVAYLGFLLLRTKLVLLITVKLLPKKS